uniref:Uncharacterized protein n=1 Tax=Arundo donax TaxID=35708 RepID=A0A0A8YBE0_ARUDO
MMGCGCRQGRGSCRSLAACTTSRASSRTAQCGTWRGGTGR